ncbi:MAG: Mrp/NBP35 family ATP-binding protein [Candidatus Symbiothrix sp.]|jgi:ATP-binding protein involved in chromosome partitioning|nr:Mrp/NBP35 family ATP-binding protein [Candidatus Symbiothrix sp.]
MNLSEKTILQALENVRYPGTGKNIVESAMIADNMRIEGNQVSFSIIFEKANDPFARSLIKAAETAILTYIDPNIDVKGRITMQSRQAPRPELDKLLPQVRNIIAVASGKGGVGKSTVSANLAIALAQAGYKVGLLDADIYGPSMPKMFAEENARPEMAHIGGRDLMVPIEKYGVKLLSIGFFVDTDSALIWRGTMASTALRQLIADADWGELDYFILDMPPGTGDIHLTLVQTLAVTGAIMVTTPQEVALADARRGIKLFRTDKVNVPILGLVENMAWFTPAELPDHRYYIFGKDGGKHLAEDLQIPFLGEIPIVQSICEGSDRGQPVALRPDTITGEAFRLLAQNVVDRVNDRNAHQNATARVKVGK